MKDGLGSQQWHTLTQRMPPVQVIMLLLAYWRIHLLSTVPHCNALLTTQGEEDQVGREQNLLCLDPTKPRGHIVYEHGDSD